jgi:LruC domain-containing protein
MGFEDIIRTASGCDHDFNDVLFYTTSNPVNAISEEDIAVLPPSDDSDGDGVKDVDDEYPSDPLRAFNNYYPSSSGKASVSFEDLWPYYGDYDMNDVVVDFRYKIVSNAANAVKDVQGNYTLRASGGQIDNNFAVEFPTLRSNVQSFTGGVLELGQTNAVAKIVSNIRSVQSRWNTVPTDPISDSINYAINFTLTNPVALSTFGLNEYNPFIWGSNNGKDRSKEIHLPGKRPTSLAADSVFGTGNDRTNRGQNNYYLSEHNLPWAILTPERFEYPIERADIVTAHLKFAAWAQSNGVLFPDWYKANANYRENTKIYRKP